MTFDTFLIAIALAFILEGLVPALFPNRWQAYVKKLSTEPVQSIRTVGISVVLMGCLMLWLVS